MDDRREYRVADRELYEAWLKTHRELPQSAISPRRFILGQPTFVFDIDSGVCLRVEYLNPDLESQQEFKVLMETLRNRTNEYEVLMSIEKQFAKIRTEEPLPRFGLQYQLCSAEGAPDPFFEWRLALFIGGQTFHGEWR